VPFLVPAEEFAAVPAEKPVGVPAEVPAAVLAAVPVEVLLWGWALGSAQRLWGQLGSRLGLSRRGCRGVGAGALGFGLGLEVWGQVKKR
jgi:hypothetical protein